MPAASPHAVHVAHEGGEAPASLERGSSLHAAARSPLALLLTLLLTCLLVVRVQALRASTRATADVPTDRLAVDDYCIGVVLQLQEAGAGLRFEPEQARRLLERLSTIEEGLMRRAGGEVASLELFAAVLQPRQERYIRCALWRRSPYVIDPQKLLADFSECCRRRAAEVPR